MDGYMDRKTQTDIQYLDFIPINLYGLYHEVYSNGGHLARWEKALKKKKSDYFL
jgi:hypothetical protein